MLRKEYLRTSELEKVNIQYDIIYKLIGQQAAHPKTSFHKKMLRKGQKDGISQPITCITILKAFGIEF